MFVVISCRLCQLLFLLYKILAKKKKHLLPFQDTSIKLDIKNVLPKWRVKIN